MYHQSIDSLRRGWRRWAIAQLVVIGSFWALLLGIDSAFSTRVLALPVLLAGLAASLIQLWIAYRFLPYNHRPNENRLFPTLGLANHLSLSRSLLYALMAGFLFLPRPEGLVGWLPALFYTVASIVDIIDGYVARRENRLTRLGEVLDIEFDGVGMFIAVGLGIHFDLLPPVFFFIAAGRPLFVLGMWLRTRLGLPNYPMTESSTRRLVAGMLMGFMAVVLWPVWSAPESLLASILFGGAVATSFFRDWLVVIGVLNPAGAGYRRIIPALRRLFFAEIPLFLRILMVPASFLFIQELSGRPIAAVLALLGTLCTLLGLGVRIGALFLIGSLALVAAYEELPLLHLSLLGISVALLILGGGRILIWQGEEEWLTRRRGGSA